jgi:hypothetical protein
MTAPNLRNISNIIGKTEQITIGSSATVLLNNPTNSDKVLKINTLLVNGDSTNAIDVTVDIFDGTTARKYGTTTIPAVAVVDFIVNKPLYLEEGKSLRLTASLNNATTATVSYEEIS